MADITFDGVSKRYGDGHLAVCDLNLYIRDGELLILVGPSGCGKSTALRMIAGLEEISEGELRIGGEVVNDLQPKDRDVAMVFQSYALYPHMTVRENMAFSLELRGLGREDVRHRVEEAARILDIEPHLDRRPAHLSGGQRQRVAMGRAIVREPAAFLMDEPLSNLDAKLRVEMRVAIAQLQRRLGTTTVYVTHDQTEAMTLGDRVAVMRAGLLQQVATPRELYADPANLFVAGFIGSPAMGFLDGELATGVVRTALGDLPLHDRQRRALAASSGSDRHVIVGLRPEAFEDAALVDPAPDAHVFEAQVDVVESVGSDVYAHLSIERTGADVRTLTGLDIGVPGDMAAPTRLIARLDPASRVSAGRGHRFRLDTAALHLFDRTDGCSRCRGAGVDGTLTVRG